jgi:hypothetical protein
MRFATWWLRRQTACGLVLLLFVPVANAEVAPPEPNSAGQSIQNSPSAQESSMVPGRETAKADAGMGQNDAKYPDNPEPIHPQNTDRAAPSSNSQTGAAQQQSSEQQPVGTAAAPYEKTTGVAASRPAGAVIAPAKQRRARSLLIRVSVVVGAAVAVGTVVALTRASPSRPN